jgi:hypothetical protein
MQHRHIGHAGAWSPTEQIARAHVPHSLCSHVRTCTVVAFDMHTGHARSSPSARDVLVVPVLSCSWLLRSRAGGPPSGGGAARPEPAGSAALLLL